MFDGKKVLITGGTGSLGTAITTRLLKTDVDTIRIYSREEFKQIQMQNKLKDKRLRFLIGDVRDKERIIRATEDIDIVIHAAALKHVPLVEYNPFEAVKTNVMGAQNVIDACFENDVKIALAVGTDKAVSPLNTYGATKFLMERLFISANYYKGNHKIKFLCVRYGNVLGSRGSIIPLIEEQIRSGKKITMTNPSMTRFNITMNQALDLIYRTLKDGIGGEIFIPKLKAYRVDVLVSAIQELMKSSNEIDIIGVRPGEKFHESLLNKDELRNTYETNLDYILVDQNSKLQEGQNFSHLKPLSTLTDQYSSDNVELFTKEELKEILTNENLIQ